MYLLIWITAICKLFEVVQIKPHHLKVNERCFLEENQRKSNLRKKLSFEFLVNFLDSGKKEKEKKVIVELFKTSELLCKISSKLMESIIWVVEQVLVCILQK